MKRWNLLRIFMFTISILPGALWAQNPNCTIIIPDAPLTAAGLATPYQLKATDPSTGVPCEETNSNSSAFVQAAILDPANGQISIYNPLVVSQDDPTPAAATVVPTLPRHAIVALWFGFNGDNLTQEGVHPGILRANNCVNGTPNSIFGQYSYCNAPAFFQAANRAIRFGRLRVPRLGFARDGLRCPTVRDFYVVDQDQSDNLPVTYLISAGQLAQNTQNNKSTLPTPTVLGNPSDNGLLDRFLDPAIGCTPWKAPDLADPGQKVPALALNELQARAEQRFPVGRIPVGDPMVLNADGSQNIAKLNAYRRGVDQFVVRGAWQASTARYCRNMLRIAPPRLFLDKALLLAGPSPVADNADSLFTFLAQRFVASYNILGCADLVPISDPISVTTDVNGVAISAVINLPDRCKRYLKVHEREDTDADADDTKSAATTE
jgi:hypothetical protein